MTEIPLVCGGVVLIDEEDAPLILQKHWTKNRRGDGTVSGVRSTSRPRPYLHRVLLKTSQGLVVDHINGDVLDNRRDNLRVCTQQQNLQNARKRKTLSSQYKGVCWHKRDHIWEATISILGVHTHLGTFHLEENAAMAYNKAAKEHFGEYAHLNEVT